MRIITTVFGVCSFVLVFSFLSSGLSYAGKKEIILEGTKGVGRIVRDGVIYDGIKRGAGGVKNRIQNRKVCERVYDRNRNANSTPSRVICR